MLIGTYKADMCMCEYTLACMWLCLCVYVCVLKCVYVHVRIYVCIHTRPYAHNDTNAMQYRNISTPHAYTTRMARRNTAIPGSLVYQVKQNIPTHLHGRSGRKHVLDMQTQHRTLMSCVPASNERNLQPPHPHAQRHTRVGTHSGR